MRTTEELFRLAGEANRSQDWARYCDLFHPTHSVYHDPFFGELRGRDNIRSWFTSVMQQSHGVAFELLFEPVFGSDAVVVESMMQASEPDGRRVPLARFCHVERYRDGWIVYAADYYDTHPVREQLPRVAGRLSQPRQPHRQ